MQFIENAYYLFMALTLCIYFLNVLYIHTGDMNTGHRFICRCE